MTENHLKILSRLTPDVRLAYDGDAAGVKATERAIMMAGDLGVNLSVISDYHGAKDPDELIQKSEKLWQEAVAKPRPAVDWLLDKYEENLDLSTGVGKREYSDVAMKLLGYVQDEVERGHYKNQIARKLDCRVEDLESKERRMALMTDNKKRLKRMDVEVAAPNALAKVKDSLQAIVLYGGVTEIRGVEVTENEVKMAELELVYDEQYHGWTKEALEAEARELLKRLKAESAREEVEKLTREMESLGDSEEDQERQAEILKRIMVLKKG